MFTGIVEGTGTVVSLEETPTGRRLVLEAAGSDELALGASIAVNGVCLTVVETSSGRISLDVIPETLSRTNLGHLAEGDKVNLERPMPADGRFDGHIVQGHVDGTGTITSIESDGEGTVIHIEAEPELMRYIVEKGSITVDGVSLTVAGVSEAGFSIALIPHTLEITTIGLRKVGEQVNLETDVLARYVERLMR